MFSTRTLVAPVLAVSCLLLVGPTTAAFSTGAAPGAGGAVPQLRLRRPRRVAAVAWPVACDLLTEADATAAIGEASGPGAPGGAGRRSASSTTARSSSA
jgi:hypothetical protein